MFESAGFPKALDENTFMEWLEKGRNSRLPVKYLIIIWNDLEENFRPQYEESREDLEIYCQSLRSNSRESLIAVYDIYSESKINTGNQAFS